MGPLRQSPRNHCMGETNEWEQLLRWIWRHTQYGTDRLGSLPRGGKLRVISAAEQQKWSNKVEIDLLQRHLTSVQRFGCGDACPKAGSQP
jgi:hypothetical protein